MAKLTVLEKPVEPDEFMCSCEDDGKARCADVRARARELAMPCEDDLDFVDRMLYALTLDGDLSITTDQWACVAVKPFDLDAEMAQHFDIKEPTRMMCDSVVDGLAAAVIYHFGENHA